MTDRNLRLHGKKLLDSHVRGSLLRPYSAQNINPGVVQLIRNITAKQPLSNCIEFGCGSGSLGKYLIDNSLISSYIGCEISPEAILESEISQLIYNQNCDDFLQSYPRALFQEVDIFIYADVLEHLDDPWSHLKHIAKVAKKNSWIVVSIPSFFHHSNLEALGRFSFEYEEWGVMDLTHLRHFGLSDMIDMLEVTGFNCQQEYGVIPSFDPHGINIYQAHINSLPVTLTFNKLSYCITSPLELMQLCAYQFVLCGLK